MVAAPVLKPVGIWNEFVEMQIQQKGSLLQDWVLTTQTGYTTMSHHYKTMALKDYLFCQQATFAYLWQVSMNLLQTRILSNSLQIPTGSGEGAPTIKDPDLTIRDVYFHSSTKVNFIYSEKARKICEISTLLLTVCTVVKSKVEISQNFVAFSEYMYFTRTQLTSKYLKFSSCTH